MCVCGGHELIEHYKPYFYSDQWECNRIIPEKKKQRIELNCRQKGCKGQISMKGEAIKQEEDLWIKNDTT